MADTSTVLIGGGVVLGFVGAGVLILSLIAGKQPVTKELNGTYVSGTVRDTKDGRIVNIFSWIGVGVGLLGIALMLIGISI